MIIFWIFTIFTGASAFAFALIALQLGIAWSVVYAVIAMLVVRGIFTLFKRWLILSERIAPEETPDERTLETNRALFWRRMRSLAILFGIYFGVFFLFYGLSPLEAMDALPGVIAAAIPQLAYFLVIMVANFMLFFGDVMTVNGKSWPFFEVQPRRYRFRVVNSSNARLSSKNTIWL